MRRFPSSYKGRVRRFGLLALILMITAMVGNGTAQAHPRDTSLLYLDVTDSTLGGRIEIPYEDIEMVFGLDLSGSSEEIKTELRANLPELQAYLDDHTAIGTGSTEWPLTFSGVSLLSESAEESFAVFPFEVGDVPRSVPRTFTVTFDPLFDELDDRESIVLIGTDWLGGVVDAESVRLIVFTPDSRTGEIDLGDTSQWKNFTSSINVGTQHLRTGADHIFFILVLLLPSVLVYSDRWRPCDRFASSLWRVLKIAGMFTLAHSITFTLAGLGILPIPPSRVVESIIALSIAVAAIHNLRPILHNREWSLAFIFGLFHGMGFASLVEALEISRSTRLVSLIGRNVGIELGQVVLIVLAFPALFLLRSTRYYRPLFVGGSIALAVVAFAWTFERVVDLDLGTNGIARQFIRWPLGLWVLLVATVVAAMVREVEKRAGRLIDRTS